MDQRANEMSDDTSEKGLCQTCNFNKQCGFMARTGDTVFFCEEFDSSSPVSVTAPSTDLPEKKVPAYGYPGQARGICVNCDEREICLPGIKGDLIWFCEEYR